MSAWSFHGYQVFWITLTSTPDSDYSRLSEHHNHLKLQASRLLGRPIEHVKVITGEGYGVIHVLWAIAPPRAGFRDKAQYIAHQWLQDTWLRVHGAFFVHIKRFGGKTKDQAKLSKYIISQYMGNQSAYVRADSSRLACVRFPLRKAYQQLKHIWREGLIRDGFYYSMKTSGELPSHRRATLYVAWEMLLARGWCLLLAARSECNANFVWLWDRLEEV